VEARRLIREGVVAAVKKHKEMPIRPLTIPGPYVRTQYFE